MRVMRVALGATVAAMVVTAAPTAQQQQTPPRAGTVAEGVRAVLVDVVVRDRRGQPVRDLAQSDFEIVEDGVAQKIGSFTPFFENAPAPPAAPPAPAGPPATVREPAAAPPVAAAAPDNRPVVTALVFDRLSPEAQRLAVQAAQSYLGTKEEAPMYIGIFGVDLALTPYAPFTRNASVLRQGLTRMSGRAATSFGGAERAQQKAAADRAASAAGQTVASAAAAGGPGVGAAMGSAGATQQLAQMESQMIADFDAMERDQQGYSTTNGLFAVIGSLRAAPRPQEPRALFRGRVDTGGRRAVVPRRHRRRQSRQRQHLYDGFRRAPRRERAGRDP